MTAVRDNGTCIRCGSAFGSGQSCLNCGVGRGRIVRNSRRHKIGGKRGRNSGKVSQHGKKS